MEKTNESKPVEEHKEYQGPDQIPEAIEEKLNFFTQHSNLLKLEIEMMSKDKDIRKIHHLYENNATDDIVFESPMNPQSEFQKQNGGSNTMPLESFVYPLSTIIKESCEYPFQKPDHIKFLRAGVRKQIFFESEKVIPCIVTCGGLCPGLNVVIRELVHTLINNYRVPKVYGIQYGYRGFYTYNWLELDHSSTNYIHKLGGTVLGSSRGGFDLKKIEKKVQKRGVNQIYVIGGDGTQKGAMALFKKFKEDKLNISVVGLPKTIDNDIPYIDRSFGYQTSVDEAIRAINSGEVEALSGEYGIGLIKVMGRAAGHIALEASLSQRGVNILLIPEVPWELYGEKGLLEYIFKFVVNKHKCVIVVAEGAGESLRDYKVENKGEDESGNVKMADIGILLRDEINKYCIEKGLHPVLKYIDPTYMIRTTSSNAFDTQMAAQLAYQAVHGAMAGFTGFCVGTVNQRSCYIPLTDITSYNRKVDVKRNKWQRFLSNARMPIFINHQEDYMKKNN